MNSQQIIDGDPGVQRAQGLLNYWQREIAIVEQRLKNINFRARGPLAQELQQKQAGFVEAQQAYRTAANLAVRTARLAEQGQAKEALQVRVDAEREAAAKELEAQVKASVRASWAGTQEQFNASWPRIYEDFLIQRSATDEATSRRQMVAHGAI